MAAKSAFLDEDLCCPVCCDIFRDPVVLGCCHSFCKVCLQRYWEKKDSQECPICRRKSQTEPLHNLVLTNVVESYLKQNTENEAVERTKSLKKSESRCSLHRKKLLFFCEEDEELLCVVCQTSKKHRSHQICPVEEAALDHKEELKAALNPTKERLEKFTAVMQECERTAKSIRSQAQQTEKQVKAEFEKLHQFLRDEEKARLAALKEEEEQKSQAMKEKIKNLSRHVFLLSDKISAIEKALDTEDIYFLKISKHMKVRAQCTLQDPEHLSGVLIDVAKHLGNLPFRVWEKMLGTLQYTPLTLDPNTSSSSLCLLDDQTSARDTETQQQLYDSTEGLNSTVTDSNGLPSGKQNWEVEVGDSPAWDVGVMEGSITKKEAHTCRPGRRFWVFMLRNGDEYKVAGITDLTIKRKPQKIRVQLDYDKGELSFHNPSDMSHIYTFKDAFTERLIPCFSQSINQ